MYTSSTMDVISGSDDDNEENQDQTNTVERVNKVIPQKEKIPDNLPKGVEASVQKDGSIIYWYQNKSYENLEDIKGFLGFPLRTAPVANKAGSFITSQLAKSDLAMGLLKSASTLGKAVELPGEESFAQTVGQGAQNWGLPYWTGETLGYLLYPGLGELKVAGKFSKLQKLQPAFATSSTNLLSEATYVASKGQTGTLSKIETVNGQNIIKGTSIGRFKIAKQFQNNKEFLISLEKQTDELINFAKANNGSLDGFPGIRTIELPDGRIFRLEPSGKTGELKFSWKSLDRADAATAKRLKSIPLDEKTLLKQFNGNKELLANYIEMNTSVVRNIKLAITKYNKGVPKDQMISLEHIFDVQHYGRLGEKIPGFSGKGADELGNLSLLRGSGSGGNYSTGAIAKNIDSGDALIELIKSDRFIDYTRTTKQFQDLNLGQKVKNFNDKDWELLFNNALNNPDKNLFQIIVEM